MPITIIAKFIAREGRADALQSALMELIVPTLNEQGCEDYALHQSLTDSNVFYFHEIWSTREDWVRHINSPHITKARTEINPLIARREFLELKRIA